MAVDFAGGLWQLESTVVVELWEVPMRHRSSAVLVSLLTGCGVLPLPSQGNGGGPSSEIYTEDARTPLEVMRNIAKEEGGTLQQRGDIHVLTATFEQDDAQAFTWEPAVLEPCDASTVTCKGYQSNRCGNFPQMFSNSEMQGRVLAKQPQEFADDVERMGAGWLRGTEEFQERVMRFHPEDFADMVARMRHTVGAREDDWESFGYAACGRWNSDGLLVFDHFVSIWRDPSGGRTILQYASGQALGPVSSDKLRRMLATTKQQLPDFLAAVDRYRAAAEGLGDFWLVEGNPDDTRLHVSLENTTEALIVLPLMEASPNGELANVVTIDESGEHTVLGSDWRGSECPLDKTGTRIFLEPGATCRGSFSLLLNPKPAGRPWKLVVGGHTLEMLPVTRREVIERTLQGEREHPGKCSLFRPFCP